MIDIKIKILWAWLIAKERFLEILTLIVMTVSIRILLSINNSYGLEHPQRMLYEILHSSVYCLSFWVFRRPNPQRKLQIRCSIPLFNIFWFKFRIPRDCSTATLGGRDRFNEYKTVWRSNSSAPGLEEFCSKFGLWRRDATSAAEGFGRFSPPSWRSCQNPTPAADALRASATDVVWNPPF